MRVFAGWTPDSDMPERYTHLFGNAACEEILEEYGLLDKGIRIDQLKPKTCTNCNEPNKIESKFCVKCKMVLSYDAYEDFSCKCNGNVYGIMSPIQSEPFAFISAGKTELG